jgi:hypothetical protein
MRHNGYFEILKKELVVALGCTEPIAIALAAATARKYVRGDKVTDLKVFASSNVIKNAMAVNIPGTGSCGINLAAALGSLAKDADKRLEVLTGLNQEDIEKAKVMIKEGKVSIDIAQNPKKLYIEVIAQTEKSSAKVIIEDRHDNIALVSFGGNSMAKFWDILVNMTNVAMTIPYMFLSIAFISFKKRNDIEKPFLVFKSYGSSLFWGVIVTLTVGFANFFSIIQPALQDNDMATTIWQIAGPIFFGLVAVIMHANYTKKIKNQKDQKVA